MQRNVQRRRALRLLAATLVAATVVAPATAEAGTASPKNFTGTALRPDSTITVAKSTTGQLAQSDPALLGRTDATPVNVVVKLDYDSTADYKGGVDGFAATSPSVTGTPMSGTSAAEKSYEGYTGKLDKTFRSKLAAAVPSATAGISLQQVYGGVAIKLPANQVAKVLAIPGVAAVQSDTLQHVDSTPVATVESPTFIGAPAIWSQVGGQALAGKGVIFGDLDTGVWPEHPMLADNPSLGNPPPKIDRTPRTCNFGDNPLTPAVDVFVCNHKLIGGQPFLQTYNANNAGEHFATSARDSDGHGTHTATTAAGDVVAHAPIFGVERGPVSGVAPGAWVIEYKVCGSAGCYGSDTAAAVQQAIKDGVNVINFSISGGAQPYTDPTELAFLSAYNAGILVAASAGNSGPGAGTTDHHGPWVLTVAASTQTREFQSTLTLKDGAATTSIVGTSIMGGVAADTPVVLAQNLGVAGLDKFCLKPLPAGSATGKIIACQRGGGGGGRVEKGKFVAAGGAAGMILYNLPLQDTESDNHYLPAIHLADGQPFLDFMAAHPTATGSFTPGVKANGMGDVMAAFSSRGPGGQFLKPDITAPGVQILAGHTPVHPDEVAVGPEGEYYQAIAGTSMSSPHIAGSGILMKALHPNWGPGMIKSALMTTANTNVLKEDEVTPADPFDFGAGRVDLTKSGSAAIVFDETAARMNSLGEDPITALDLNLASINVPTMPGTVTVHRTATNVTSRAFDFNVSTTAPAGSKIKVTPDHGRIRAGLTQTFTITISSNAASGQYFGQIMFNTSNGPALHMPVAFFNQQGSVTLTQSCDPASIAVRATTTCTVTATNNAAGPAAVSMTSKVSNGLQITAASGATVNRRKDSASAGPAVLAAPIDGAPTVAPVDPNDTPAGGYLDLGLFGIAPTPLGDESITNFTIPTFEYGGKPYTKIGVDSNGYIVVGGGDAGDNNCCTLPTFPDAARPNGVLAPYWTDLDGKGAPGLSVGTLTDGVDNWVVVQWDTFIYGDYTAAGSRRMQVWIGVNGTQDITYQYDTNTIGKAAPADPGLRIGAESVSGTTGNQIAGPPTGPYRVTSTDAVAYSISYTLTIKGTDRGHQKLSTSMLTDVVAGSTNVVTPIEVTRR